MADETERKTLVHAAVEISVDPNYTTAFMSITPPENGGLDMTFEKAMAAIQAKNIYSGIDEDAVRSAVEGKHYFDNICIAKWTPPVDGEDGEITFRYNKENNLAPVEGENGVVDYKNLGLVRNIMRGTIIADIKFPTDGTPGKDIMGRPVNQRVGTPAKFNVGKGTELINDGANIAASIDGNLRFDLNCFVVDEELFIKEDIDVSSGNIDFIGNIVIRGNVLEGFCVTSKKNITVNGSVNGAKLTAGGDVTVRIGVVNSEIFAGGEIRMGFCENSNVHSESYIECPSFVGGEVFSGGKITAVSKGVMMGGKYTALDNIEAGSIGSESYVRTQITLGNNAILSEERDTLQRNIADMENKLDQLGKVITTLTEFAKTAKLPPEREQMKAEAVRSKLKMQMEIKKATQRIEQINQSLMINQSLTVSARRAFYPGVTLRINDCYMQVNTTNNFCRATIENGEIAFKPL